MKNLHVPRTLAEVVHSPITLVTGTATLTTAVLLSYQYIRNADGNLLLDVAFGNLFSMVQMMIA